MEGALILGVGVVVVWLYLRLRNGDEKLNNPVSSWTDEELMRRLPRYVKLRTAAGNLAVGGNLDAINRCAEAGKKVKEIEEEIKKRQDKR